MAATTTAGQRRSSGGGFRNFWNGFKRSVIWRMLARQKWWIVGLFFLSLVRGVLYTSVLNTVRAIVDNAIIDNTVPLEPLIGRLLVLSLITFVFGFASSQVGDKIGWTIEYDLRNWVYDRIQRMSPRELDRLPTGQLVTRAAVELEALERFIRFIPALIPIGLLMLVVVIYGFTLNPLLGLLAFLGLPVDVWIVNKIKGKFWAYNYLHINQRAVVTQAVDEPIRGIRVVKAFGREEHVRDNLRKEAAQAYRFRMTLTRYFAKFDIVLSFIPAAVHGLVMVVGAWLVISQGAMTVGDILVFFSIARAIVGFTGFFDELVNIWQRTKTSIGRIQELITWAPPERPKQDAVALPEPSTGLELRDVTADAGGRTVLDGIDLTARPGSLTVVTGRRGSGKTLLASVASGAHPVKSGDVVLDGIPVSAADPVELRQVIRVVNEDAFLFARSVRENLKMGVMAGLGAASNPTDDDLFRALQAAGADEVMEHLDNGLDTVLGDRGLTLSGGQRQRLALARALVHPPRVLILDDSLSAVPPGLEIEILQRIRRTYPDLGIIVLSRREAAEVVADDVIALPDPPDDVVNQLAHEQLVTAGATTEVTDASETDDDNRDMFGRRTTRRTGNLGDRPYDDNLIPLLDGIPLSDDQPKHMGDDLIADPRPPGYWNTLRVYAGRLAVGTLILLLTAVLELLPAGITGMQTDALNDNELAAAIWLGLAVVGLALARGIISAAFRIFRQKADAGILYFLRRRLFHRLTNLGVDYYDRELPGDVATRLVYDLDIISDFTEESIYALLRYTSQILIVAGIIMALSVEVGIYLVLFIPVAIAVTLLQMPFYNRQLLRAREWTGRSIARLQEDFAGRYVINSYGVGAKTRREYHDINNEVRKAKRAAATLQNVYTEFIELAGALATVIIFLRAGNLVIGGALTIGTLVAINRYFDEAMDPIPRMGRLWQALLRVMVSFRMLRKPFEAPVNPPLADSPIEALRLDGDISFEAVSFAYPHTGRTVLSDVTFEVGGGETVALVGNTGAGKSSIAKLLSRIYDPTQGRITVNGVDLRAYDPASMRRHIAVVPQEAFVFRGTVWSNIGFGRPDASQEDIEAAAIAVGAYDALLAIPDGVVEEEGRNITPAQRQLIALARAWLVGPDILILDEATSALDEATEASVLEALSHLDCTKVLITHRQVLAEAADFVICLDRGRIVEAGTHDELFGAGGYYDALWGTALVGAGSRSRRRTRTNGSSGNGRSRSASRSASSRRRSSSSSSSTSTQRRARRNGGATEEETEQTARSNRRAPASTGRGAASSRRRSK